MPILALFFAAALTSQAAAATPPNAAPTYAVVKRFAVGEPGGWDYLALDSATHRLYISRSDRVLVLDSDTGKAIATIPGTDGVHGIVLLPELGRGYTSNGRADTLTEFDLATSKVLRTIPVQGHNPDALIYDAPTKHLFAFNGRSHDASVIDPVAGKVVATIPLSGKPEFAVSDGAGQVFVNIEDSAQLVRIDAAKAKVTAIWKLQECEEPTGLALDTKHRRLFSTCQNQRMAVTDANSGKQMTSVVIGKGPDAAAFDAERALVFSTNGEDGTLTVIHEDDADHYRVIANVPTQASARTLALDPASHRIYTVAAQFGSPPAATPSQSHPRPSVIDGSFTVLVVGDKGNR